jgi:hypothetical protein
MIITRQYRHKGFPANPGGEASERTGGVYNDVRIVAAD